MRASGRRRPAATSRNEDQVIRWGGEEVSVSIADANTVTLSGESRIACAPS